jgi:hypothetical protein
MKHAHLQEPGTPYTHWMYFPDRASADACAAELPQYFIRIDPPDEDVPEFLLRAERNVLRGWLSVRHREVESIVKRHGGWYDFGEATFAPDGPMPDPCLHDFGPPKS